MTETSTEMISLAEVARRCNVHHNTVNNWLRLGVKPRRGGGPPIFLSAKKMGGNWRTTVAELESFLRQVNGAVPGAPPAATAGLPPGSLPPQTSSP